jgi:hypothetical protein
MTEHANLLPASFQQRAMLRRRLVQWATVWLGTLLLLAAGAMWRVSSEAALRQEVLDLEEQCGPLRELAQENQTIRDRLAEISGRQSLFAELDRAQRPLQVLGIISESALATDQQLHVDRLQLSPIAQPTDPKPATTKAATAAAPPVKEVKTAPNHTSLVLSGLATDDLAVARFISGLRHSGVFHKVELQSSSRVPHLTGHARRYEIDCAF